MVGLTQLGDLPVVSGLPWPGVGYCTTTRHGGVSQGPCTSLNFATHVADQLVHVQENRRRLQQHLPGPAQWVHQVHGVHAHHVTVDKAPSAMTVDEQSRSITADALITSKRSSVLAILTADCLPVVIGACDGSIVAVAHAGWRGLQAGVLENTVYGLQAYAPGKGLALRAWIGPSISQKHFEVGPEVREQFLDNDAELAAYFRPGATRKYLADLAGIAQHRLQGLGVTQIDISPYCTYGRPDLFFSYRRQNHTGRQATLVWRTP